MLAWAIMKARFGLINFFNASFEGVCRQVVEIVESGEVVVLCVDRQAVL